MTISANDVRRLLASESTDAVLVLLEGRTDVVDQERLDSEDYRGALRVVSRAELLDQTHTTELSDHELAEEAAKLDAAVTNLGG